MRFCCYTALALHRETPDFWIERAIQLAIDNVRTRSGGPFGALIVRNDELIATGVNRVTSTNDPTAHAEVVVIRAACERLGAFQLSGCELYTSCEPCPMCLGAIYWARPTKFYYGCTRERAALAGFDDALIYNEIALPPDRRSIPGYCISAELAQKPFEEWRKAEGNVPY
jgi:guanine deaminase